MATDIVTGSFSNIGKFITERLLAKGRGVRTLTGHPGRADVFGGQVPAFPYDFERPHRLEDSLRGADTLYNSYWVRFDQGSLTYERAVENTRILIEAAARAGIRKVVQISIANASKDSPFRYYKGKAALEQIVRDSGLDYAILRPTVIFGPDCVLLNNIAWFLRRFPAFMIPGDGNYRIQPVFVEDLADLAVSQGADTESRELDAVGPEIFTYNELVRLIAAAIGANSRIVHVPRGVAVAASRVLGRLVGDVVLTPEEVDGLMADILISGAAPTCASRLTDWLSRHGRELGERYISELKIHFKKEPARG